MADGPAKRRFDIPKELPVAEPSNPPRLIIVCGLPGSGKTIHAKRIEQTLRAVRFSPDEWMEALEINLWDSAVRDRIEQLQWKLAQNLLSFGHNVIIEWGTWGRSERDTLRLGARALGAAVELHYLDAPADILLERVRVRNRESPPVTRQDILEWAEVFQRPTAEEIALFDARSC
jgi:predicted kinase